MTTTSAMAELPDGLAAWVEHEVGASITGWRRPTTGGSRSTFVLDLDDPDLPSVVLRTEGEGSFTGTELTLAREATAYAALARTAVPVPRVLARSDDGRSVVLQRLAGSDDLASLPDEERAAVFDDFATVLAELHELDVDRLDLPGFARPVSTREHAQLDVEMWQRLSRGATSLDPLCAYAGGWLHAHPPERVQRTCFVQGDTGPGNFLADRGRVTGLVDLEFAHIGDPMDDLAWVELRMASWPAELDALLATYEARSALRVDRASVAYYSLAVQFRCAVTTSLAVSRGGGARGWTPYLLVTRRYLDGIAQRIAVLTGIEAEVSPEWADPPTPRTALFDELSRTIRDAVRGIADDALRESTRNSQILVHLLRAEDRYGTTLRTEDDRDRSSVVPSITDAELVAWAEESGRRGDEQALRYLLRRHQRIQFLWQSLIKRV